MTNDFQIYIESAITSLPVPSFHPRLAKGQRVGKEKRNYRDKIPVLFQTSDYQEALWEVTKVRPTKHGFDLLLGYRIGTFFGLGPSRVIVTRELKDFWETNKVNAGFAYTLPAGRTTLKRIRKRLGYNFRKAMSKYWMDRLGDLGTMRPRDFAVKHGIAREVAFDTRRRLLGKVAREKGWWNQPAILEFLRSDVKVREISEKLGVSLTQACRLRMRAQQKSGPSGVLPANATIQEAKGWWRTPEKVAILLSDASLGEIAEKLGVNRRQVSRLQFKARLDYGS
jgi:hypothetical protein